MKIRQISQFILKPKWVTHIFSERCTIVLGEGIFFTENENALPIINHSVVRSNVEENHRGYNIIQSIAVNQSSAKYS